MPSCDDCEKWVYDPQTWRRVERPAGTPVRREANQATPCWKCPKIPRGEQQTPAVGRTSELTEQSWQVYEHYLRCKAVGRFPVDALVERHAAIIRQVEDLVEQHRQIEPIMALAAMLGKP